MNELMLCQLIDSEQAAKVHDHVIETIKEEQAKLRGVNRTCFLEETSAGPRVNNNDLSRRNCRKRDQK